MKSAGNSESALRAIQLFDEFTNQTGEFKPIVIQQAEYAIKVFDVYLAELKSNGQHRKGKSETGWYKGLLF